MIVVVGDTSSVKRSQIVVSYDNGNSWAGKVRKKTNGGLSFKTQIGHLVQHHK